MEFNLSLFLARFFGIYFLIFAILWLLRQDRMKDLIKDIFSKPALLAVTGIISLMLGIAIVVSHNVYAWSWQGFITLLRYLSILKGIIRLSFPKHDKKMALSMIKGNRYWFAFLYTFACAICANVSSYIVEVCTWFGFYPKHVCDICDR